MMHDGKDDGNALGMKPRGRGIREGCGVWVKFTTQSRSERTYHSRMSYDRTYHVRPKTYAYPVALYGTNTDHVLCCAAAAGAQAAQRNPSDLLAESPPC